jgi:hypothetical protein
MANIMKHEHVFSYQEADKDLDLVKLSGRLETKPRYEKKAEHQSIGAVSKQKRSFQNTGDCQNKAALLNNVTSSTAARQKFLGGGALGWLSH